MKFLRKLFRPTIYLGIAIVLTVMLLNDGLLFLDGRFGVSEVLAIAVWTIVWCERSTDRPWARPVGCAAVLTVAGCMLWIRVSLWSMIGAAFLAWSAFTEFQPEEDQPDNDKDESDDQPIQSIVLLQNETRYLDANILAKTISEAWEIEVVQASDDDEEEDGKGDSAGESEDESVQTSVTLFGDSAPFMCMYWPALFVIHNIPEPYVEDVDGLISQLADVRMKEAVASHCSWLSVDLLKWMGDNEDDGKKVADRLIGQLLAELCDDTCVAVLDLMTGRIYPSDPELIEKLRSDDPREALADVYYAPITQVSADDPEMIAAVEQATSTWPEFVEAFEKRDDTPNTESFAVKAPFGEDDNIEFMWASVTAIEGDVIYGKLGNDPANIPSLKEGDRVTVPLKELNDWMYLRDGEIVGGFTVEILMRRYGQAGENEEPDEPDQS